MSVSSVEWLCFFIAVVRRGSSLLRTCIFRTRRIFFYDRFTDGFCDCGHADFASPARLGGALPIRDNWGHDISSNLPREVRCKFKPTRAATTALCGRQTPPEAEACSPARTRQPGGYCIWYCMVSDDHA